MNYVFFIFIGALLLLNSTANASLMQIPSTTLLSNMENLGTAKLQSNQFMLFAGNTSVSNTVNFTAPAVYKFDISAYGTMAQNIYPKMRVSIDSVVLKTIDITSSSAKTYSFTHSIIQPGQRQIKIEFINDLRISATEDRNLYVRFLQLSVPAVTANVPSTLMASVMSGRSSAKIASDNSMKLSGSGFVSNAYNLVSGNLYKFSVKARGTALNGVFPKLRVLIDDIVIKDLVINSSTEKDFIFNYKLLRGGVREIKLAYLNDAVAQDLFVKSLNMSIVDQDQQGPTIKITGPTSLTTEQAASFSFTVSDASGVNASLTKCQLDAGAYTTTACVSPKSYAAGLSEQSHVFRVKAVDTLGNESVASHTFAVSKPVVVPPVDPTTPTVTPVFKTMGAIVDPAMAEVGQSVVIKTALQSNVSVSDITVDIEVRDIITAKAIYKKAFAGEDFVAKVTKPYTVTFDLPNSLAPGSYYLTVATFNSNWSKTYYWNNNAAPLYVVAATIPNGQPLLLPGVNLSGAEFNGGKKDARIGWDYVYPTNSELDYFAAKGAKIIRMPFNLNRLQPTRLGALNETEFAIMEKVILYAKSKNLIIMLDPHNYGTMKASDGKSYLIGAEPQVPVAHFADFWKKLSARLINQSHVYFNLMNEPSDRKYTDAAGQKITVQYTPQAWKAAAIAAINAIRATGAKQKILIPGVEWTGAHSWVSSGNAAAWVGFDDINFAFEVHQYLDQYSSGGSASCSKGGGSKRLVAFTNWARTNGYQGFLGEVGWAENAGCMVEGQAIMNYMSANSDIWLGFTYWAGGPWMGDYYYTIEPYGLGTPNIIDRVSMTIIKDFFRK